MNEILLYLGLGTAAGILSGLFGIGGGLILVPSLIFFAGMSQLKAQGTSLGALLLPVGIFAALRYSKDENVAWKTALLLSLGLSVGAYFGSLIANNIPVVHIKKLFGVLLVIVGVRFVVFSK